MTVAAFLRNPLTIDPLGGMGMGWSRSLDKLAAHVRAVTAAGG